LYAMPAIALKGLKRLRKVLPAPAMAALLARPAPGLQVAI